jgi:hypothetical protein
VVEAWRQQLLEPQRQAADLSQGDGKIPQDELFTPSRMFGWSSNAEEYYRSMFRAEWARLTERTARPHRGMGSRGAPEMFPSGV